MNHRNVSIAVRDSGHGHLFGLDLVRCVAIMLVVLNHCTESVTDLKVSRWWDALCSPDAVLFLILSGALLLPVSRPTGEFLRRRASRIVAPWIMWSVVYALLNYWLITGSESWLAFEIRWFWLDETFSEGWFIPVIIGLYLFFPILSPWIRSATRRQTEYFLLLWCLALCLPLMSMLMGVDKFESTVFGAFYGYVGYAVAGFYFMRWPLGRGCKCRSAVMSALLVAVGFILPLSLTEMTDKTSYFVVSLGNLSICTAASAMLLFAWLSRVGYNCTSNGIRGFAAMAVRSVAACSFAIYLAHPVLSRYLIPEYWPEFAGSALEFPVVFVAAWTAAWVLKRIPVVNHLFT